MGGGEIPKGGDIPRRFAPLGGDIPRRFAPGGQEYRPPFERGANLLGGTESPVTPDVVISPGLIDLPNADALASTSAIRMERDVSKNYLTLIISYHD